MKIQKVSDAIIIIASVVWISAFLTVSAAMAHDWGITKTELGYDVVMAHFTDHGIESDIYEPDRVIKATGYLENGKRFPVSIQWKADLSGSSLDVLQECSALTALVYNKYWMQTTRGWQDRWVPELKGVIKEGHSYKVLKYIEHWHDGLTKPLGVVFEIVPLKNPAALSKKEQLPVRLFFMGESVYKASITLNSRKEDLIRVETDDYFLITLSPQKTQFINAKIEVPVKDKKIIWYAAALTFDTDVLNK